MWHASFCAVQSSSVAIYCGSTGVPTADSINWCYSILLCIAATCGVTMSTLGHGHLFDIWLTYCVGLNLKMHGLSVNQTKNNANM